MSFYDQFGGGNHPPMNPMQMLNQIRQDPVSVLKQAGMNIPAGMKDPQQIIQHLLNSGQVPQSRYQQALQMMSRMRR